MNAVEETLDLKANIASPTFTGTVSGITSSMVGLSNVDNTSDSGKPVSTAQQTALDLKANIASPTFTGTVGGITSSMVGLSNVDNTSDSGKPVSTAQQTALDLKANLASPTFTGTVSAPTQLSTDNTTKVATTAYVKTVVGELVDGAPGTIDTLKEVAAALGDDPNFATTVTNSIASKATIASPTFTGTVGGITKTMVGLSNVDNTSDALKPVSTAQQTALDLKANIASPTFTGTVSATTFVGDGSQLTGLSTSNDIVGTVSITEPGVNTGNMGIITPVSQSIIKMGSTDFFPQIHSIRNGNYTDNTDLQFWTSGINTHAFPAMTIKGYSNHGNVGIGTTDPSSNLHISSGTSGNCVLTLEADTDNNAEGDTCYIDFKQDGGNIWNSIYTTSNQLNIANTVGSGGGIVFRTYNVDTPAGGHPQTNAIERMKIENTGDITMTNDLSVGGNLTFTGKYSQVVPSADDGNQVFTQTNTSYRRSNQPHHIDTYNHGTSGSGGRRLYLNWYSNSDVSVGGTSGGNLICENEVYYKGQTLDNRFVNVTGDTMSGTLDIAGGNVGFNVLSSTRGNTHIGGEYNTTFLSSELGTTIRSYNGTSYSTIADFLTTGITLNKNTAITGNLTVGGNIYGNNNDALNIYRKTTSLDSESWIEIRSDKLAMGGPYIQLYAGSNGTNSYGSERLKIETNKVSLYTDTDITGTLTATDYTSSNFKVPQLLTTSGQLGTTFTTTYTATTTTTVTLTNTSTSFKVQRYYQTQTWTATGPGGAGYYTTTNHYVNTATIAELEASINNNDKQVYIGGVITTITGRSGGSTYTYTTATRSVPSQTFEVIVKDRDARQYDFGYTEIITDSITQTSDDRLKTNESIIENATTTLMKLCPQNYIKHSSFISPRSSNDVSTSNIMTGSELIELRNKYPTKDELQVGETELVSQMPVLLDMWEILDVSGNKFSVSGNIIDSSGDQITFTIPEPEIVSPDSARITHSGLIAQEVYYNAPELRHLVTNHPSGTSDMPLDLSGNLQIDPDYSSMGWSDTPSAVNYIGLIPYLIKSNQELHGRIAALETKIIELENNS